MHSINYLIRAKEIQDFAAQFYEPGRHDKCYKQVWLKHVFPKYGFNYDTFLRYMRVDTSCLEELLVEQE